MTGSLEGLPTRGSLPRWSAVIIVNWVVVQAFVFLFVFPTISTGRIQWVGLSMAILLELASIWATVSYWCVIALLAMDRNSGPVRRDWLYIGSWLIRHIYHTVNQVSSS